MAINEFNLASSEKQDEIKTAVDSKASQTSLNAVKADTANIRSQFPIDIGVSDGANEVTYVRNPIKTGPIETLVKVNGKGELTSCYVVNNDATYESTVSLTIKIDGQILFERLATKLYSTNSTDSFLGIINKGHINLNTGPYASKKLFGDGSNGVHEFVGRDTIRTMILNNSIKFKRSLEVIIHPTISSDYSKAVVNYTLT